MHKFHRPDLEAIDSEINERQQAADFSKILTGSPIVLDVGANRGQWAERVLSLNPSAQIYSFEPVPESFSTLQTWADQVDADVRPYNIAISAGGE